MKKIIFPLFLISIILFSYQNCSDVKLQEPSTSTSASILTQGLHPVSAEFCIPQENGLIYDLFGSLFVINLNAIPHQGTFAPDSDSDGVADSDEVAPFDPLNSHSQNILDYICFKAGKCSSPCATPTSVYYSLGLTQCDIQSYTSTTGTYNKFDSNTDSIPDFIEIIRRGDPFREPNTDLDQDGRTLIEEIRDQTDPEWPDSPRLDLRPIVTKIANDASCVFPAKHYLITTQNQPFVPVKKYTDPFKLTIGTQSFDLSHQANENVIGIFISTYSLNATPAVHRGYFYLGRIQDTNWPTTSTVPQSINVKTSDFVKAEEWQW